MSATDFSIEEFHAWALTKPADEEYDFRQARRCAVAQYGIATNRPQLVGMRWLDLGNADAVHAVINGGEGWTFGALADRLEALLPKTSLWVKVEAYQDALTDAEVAEYAK